MRGRNASVTICHCVAICYSDEGTQSVAVPRPEPVSLLLCPSLFLTDRRTISMPSPAGPSASRGIVHLIQEPQLFGTIGNSFAGTPPHPTALYLGFPFSLSLSVSLSLHICISCWGENNAANQREGGRESKEKQPLACPFALPAVAVTCTEPDLRLPWVAKRNQSVAQVLGLLNSRSLWDSPGVPLLPSALWNDPEGTYWGQNYFIFIDPCRYWGITSHLFFKNLLIWEVGERNINWLPPIRTPTGDQTCNLSMCLDQESNPQPFSLWDDAPTNWTTPPRPNVPPFKLFKKLD